MDHHSQSILYVTILAFVKYLHYSSKKQKENLKQKRIDDAAKFHELGLQNMKLKHYHQATVNYSQAVNLNPIDLYYNNRACACTYAKKYDKALEDYNYLLSFNENEGSYYFGRGVVYYELEKFDLAKNDFEKANALKFELAKDYLRQYFDAKPAWINGEVPINHNVFMLDPKPRNYKRLLFSINQESSYCQTFYYCNKSHFNQFLN